VWVRLEFDTLFGFYVVGDDGFDIIEEFMWDIGSTEWSWHGVVWVVSGFGHLLGSPALTLLGG